ncbi:hypothetical protein EVAR_60803_1 [Eumeta japonica]|uniref:Uncharacterized protein n=1 Tax=Eumeta variegata TaxID=151549 RepID=A0A4C1YMZ6_EUMVA|nr:hypothetical protein EVAR_60803_1 [Eumeta japonica]
MAPRSWERREATSGETDTRGTQDTLHEHRAPNITDGPVTSVYGNIDRDNPRSVAICGLYKYRAYYAMSSVIERAMYRAVLEVSLGDEIRDEEIHRRISVTDIDQRQRKKTTTTRRVRMARDRQRLSATRRRERAALCKNPFQRVRLAGGHTCTLSDVWRRSTASET